MAPNGKAGGWQAKANNAIREITETLQQQNGQGKVWIEKWGQRYETDLGSMRDFLLGQPQHFKVIPGEGRKFTVALAKKGISGPKIPAAPKGAKGGTARAALTNGGGWGSGAKGSGKSTATHNKGAAALGNGAAWGKGSKRSKGQRDGYDPVTAAAIREIKDQLRGEGNAGHVWIDHWKESYQAHLGKLREFLESRPDKFVVYAGQGKKFTVGLPGWEAPAAAPAQSWSNKRKAESPGKAGPSKFAKVHQRWDSIKKEFVEKATPALPAPEEPKKDETEEELTEAAVGLIKKQLKRPGSNGMVWINGWNRRFAKTLGTLREFLEVHPEHFDVIPGEGKKFTVEVMDI